MNVLATMQLTSHLFSNFYVNTSLPLVIPLVLCVSIYLLHLKPDPAPLPLELCHTCWMDSRDEAAHTGSRETLSEGEGQELQDTSHLWCKCRLVGLCCTVGTESYTSFWCLYGTVGTKTNQPTQNPLGEGVTKMHEYCGSVVLVAILPPCSCPFQPHCRAGEGGDLASDGHRLLKARFGILAPCRDIVLVCESIKLGISISGFASSYIICA